MTFLLIQKSHKFKTNVLAERNITDLHCSPIVKLLMLGNSPMRGAKFYREMPKPKENHWIRNKFTLWERIRAIRAIRNEFTKNLCESKTTMAFHLRLLSWLCCNLNWMSCTISLYVSRARGNFVSFEGLVWKKLMWIISPMGQR